MIKKTFDVYFFEIRNFGFGAVSKTWIEKENINPKDISGYGVDIADCDISDFLETVDLPKPKIGKVTIEFKEE